MKTCTGCKKTKPIEQFSLSRRATETTKEVHRSRCKECQAERARNWYNTNQERANENRRRWNLMNNYGLTVEEYDAMYDSQQGLCAICGGQESRTRLAVDHCHTTGAVRGLLCHTCNRAIGLLNDNIDTLEKAIDYLKKGSDYYQ